MLEIFRRLVLVALLAVGFYPGVSNASFPPRLQLAPVLPQLPTPSQQSQSARGKLWQVQQRRIDSVRALVDGHPRQDSTRVVLLTHLASEIKLQNVRAARPVLHAALRLARRLAVHDLVAETLLDLADYHITLAEYGPANDRLSESRQEFARLRDLGGEIRCLGRLATVADQQGKYAASLAYCFQGLALPLTSDTRRFNTSLKIQAGNTFTKLGDYGHAREYLLDALQVARKEDYPDRINIALGGLGDVCRSQKQWVAARRYYEQSRAVSRRLANAPQVLAMQLNLAEVSERQGNYQEAFALGYPALRQSIAAGQLLAIPRAQGLLARAFLRKGQLDSAIAYGLQSLRTSQQVRYNEGARAANEVLALAYASRKDFSNAYKASIGRKVFNDSLLSEATTRRTAALQLNFELGKQQAQIKLLTQQARLQTQQRELSRLRQHNQLIGLGAVGLLSIIAASFLFWRYRQRQVAREKDLRVRLAADLRDDVGSLLRQISLQSNLLQEGLADAAGQRIQITRLSDDTRYAVRQLNDVVWSIEGQHDHLAHLLARMQEYAHEVLCPHGIHMEFEGPELSTNPRLPAALRRNLYLIYKESLQNVLKHAQGATRATVHVRLNGSQLLVDVTDDGQPTVQPRTATFGQRAGRGLAAINGRAAALGGAATAGPFLAANGEVLGFRVRVAVPFAFG